MNRQRRLEAIARRRAYIESQIQMLNSKESKIPNIIRSRTGRPPSNKPRLPNFQAVECVASRPEDASTESFQQTPNTESLKSTTNSSGEVYLSVVNGDGDNENQVTFQIEGNLDANSESIPIVIPDEIAKLLSAGVTDQLGQTLQTIRTEDGTVMVVLEGSNVNENETDTNSNIDQSTLGEEICTEAQAVSVPLDDQPTDTVNTEEVTTEEESYVIVQTEHGELLVPSSSLCSQFQPQVLSSPEENNVVQFVTTKNATITKAGTNKKATPLAKKKIPASRPIQTKPIRKVGTTSGTPPVVKKPYINLKNYNNNLKSPKDLHIHSKPVNEKRKVSPKLAKAQTIAIPSDRPVSSASSSYVNEKPRPFRFEMPELEDTFSDLNDSFMSVPVPIKIGSLKSETGKTKSETVPNVEAESSSYTTTSYRIVETNHSEAATGDREISHSFIGSSNADSNSSVLVKAEDNTQDSYCPSEQNSQNLVITSTSSLVITSVSSNVPAANVTSSEVSSPVTSSTNSLISCISEQYAKPVLISSGSYDQLSSNDENVKFCVQMSDEEVDQCKLSSKNVKLCNNNNTIDPTSNVVVAVRDYQAPSGRRTLSKATLMTSSPGVVEVTDGDMWELTSTGNTITTDSSHQNSNSMTIQSARIQSRNDRIRAMDGNETDAETLEFNFRNIFEQVKQSVTLN